MEPTGCMLTFALFAVQSLSCAQMFATLQTAANQSSLSFTIPQSLLRLMSFELMMPANHLILCRPLFLLPSTFFSIRIFSCESALHIRQPKHWSFIFSMSSPSEYSELSSFRTDWLDLDLVCPRVSKESSLAPHFKGISSSALNLLYGPTITFTTRKNIALTIWNFVSKVMSLLFNKLARCVTAFLPRS